MKSRVFWLVLALVIIVAGVVIYLVWRSGQIQPQASTPSSTPGTLSLMPQTGSINVNDTLSVKINFNTTGQMVKTIQAQLNYDPSKLAIQAASPVAVNSSIFTSDINRKDSEGQITIGVSTVADNFNGPGELGTIEFKALSPATSSSVTFNASNTLMAYTPPGGTSSDTIEIPVTATGATYTITQGTTPASVSLTANGQTSATVSSGTSVTLAWTITGKEPAVCTATPAGWFPTSASATGTATVRPTTTTTYNLNCEGTSGQIVVTVSSTPTPVPEPDPNCSEPLTETRTQTCPTGQTGSITQRRVKTNAPTCAWSDWTTTTSTCTTTSTGGSGTTGSATTGPAVPLAAGGALSIILGAYYFIKKRLG